MWSSCSWSPNVPGRHLLPSLPPASLIADWPGSQWWDPKNLEKQKIWASPVLGRILGWGLWLSLPWQVRLSAAGGHSAVDHSALWSSRFLPRWRAGLFSVAAAHWPQPSHLPLRQCFCGAPEDPIESWDGFLPTIPLGRTQSLYLLKETPVDASLSWQRDMVFNTLLYSLWRWPCRSSFSWPFLWHLCFFCEVSLFKSPLSMTLLESVDRFVLVLVQSCVLIPKCGFLSH